MTPSATPVADVLLTFSFVVAPAASGVTLSASTLSSSAPVLSSISSNIAGLLGNMSVALVKVVSVTDIATGAVSLTGKRLLAGGAAGSAGVRFAVTVNLGKTTSPAHASSMASRLQANFSANSPAFRVIIGSVAQASSGVLASMLSGEPPTDLLVDGLQVNSARSSAVSSDLSGKLSTNEGVGVGIGFAVAIGAIALFTWRYYKSHGALWCFHNRRAELYRLTAAAEAAATAKFDEGTEVATIDNPVALASASAGVSGKLTLRVPKAIKAVLERNNAALAHLEAKLKAAEADNAALASLSAKLKAAEAQLASQAAVQVLAPAPAPARANFAPVSMLPPPQTQALLPPGWREAKDPLSGQSYWFNAATQQTSWKNPSQAF